MNTTDCKTSRLARVAVAILIGALVLGACSNENSAGDGSNGSSSGTGTVTAPCGTPSTCVNTALSVFSTVSLAFSSAFTGISGTGQINAFTFHCTYNGDVTVNGTYDTSASPFTYGVTLQFAGCDTGTTPTTDELVIDGPISMSGTIDTNGYGTYIISSTGLSVSGQSRSTPVSFNCPFDLNLTYSAGPTYRFRSTVCGVAYNY